MDMFYNTNNIGSFIFYVMGCKTNPLQLIDN